MRRLLIFLVAIIIFLPQNLAAAKKECPSLRGVSVDTGPRIDGSLSDVQWTVAEWYHDFRQSVPNYGAPASERTEVAILFDENNIYVGVRCFDSRPDEIVARQLMHRNSIRRDDHITVLFDTYQDQQRASMFQINPLGAREEGQVSGNHNYNMDWNEVWDGAAQLTLEGWEAEFRIPLRVLRFRKGRDQTWAMNVGRTIRRKREEVYLSPPEPPRDIGSLNYYAELTNLRLQPDQRNLQFKPYVLGGSVYTGENDETVFERDAGLDIKYSVTSDLTLDMTYNTDFAQVESDAEQVNLTRFSLFFPEKRDFFLENAQLFSFGRHSRWAELLPFFSRRIGLHEGNTVPIDFGARLTGKIGNHDVGLLSIRTDSAYITTDEEEYPLDRGFYNVARIRRNLNGRSYLGGIFTNSRRGELNSSTLGVDGSWWLHDNLSLTGYFLTVQQDDIADQHIAWKVNADYTSDAYGIYFDHTEVGENFEPDLGFVRRSGFRRNSVFLRRSIRPGNWLRKYSVRVNSSWTTSMAGPLETIDSSLRMDFELESGDRINVNVNRVFERLFEPFDLDDDFVFAEGDYDFNEYEFNFWSNGSRALRLELNGRFGGYFNANRRDLGFELRYALSRYFQVEFDMSNYLISRSNTPDINWTVFGLNTRVTFNSSFMISSFLQYNSSTGNVSLNLRAHFLYGKDSDLFIVFNEQRLEDELNTGYRLESRQALVKINYRFFL